MSTWNPSVEELTEIYKQANGFKDPKYGNRPPITTNSIYNAMRKCHEIGAASAVPEDSVVVNSIALRQILMALNGPGHLIRELQYTRNVSKLLGEINPIDRIVNDFNNYVNKKNDNQADNCGRDERGAAASCSPDGLEQQGGST